MCFLQDALDAAGEEKFNQSTMLILFFLFDTASTQSSHSNVLPGFSFFSEVNFVTRDQV